MKKKIIPIEKSRTFTFGKVAAWPTNRKANEVQVTVSLRTNEYGEKCFVASGKVWNTRHTDCIGGGQNLDEIHKWFGEDPLFCEIYALWKKYHLNDFNSGTYRQEIALHEETERINAENAKNGKPPISPLTHAVQYDEACDFLKSIGLYYDSLGKDEVIICNGEGEKNTRKRYAYGTGWILRRIPEADMKRIESLIFDGKVLETP